MHTRRFFVTLALCGLAIPLGLLPRLSVRAQDAPPKTEAHVVIRTEDGEQAFDIDPKDLPDMSGAAHSMAVLIGPDGKVVPLNGKLGIAGADGFRLNAVDGIVGMKGIDVIDPGDSYLLPLLKREDVQAQLFLSPRQREALDALQKNQQQAMQQQVKQSVLSALSEISGKSREEQRSSFMENSAKMREELVTLTNDRYKKMAAILTPTQWARLRELDLQWRGPLAMGVKDVAEQATLTTEQRPVVADFLKQYHQKVNKQLSMNFNIVSLEQKTKAGTHAARSQSPTPSPAPTTPAEMQAQLDKTVKELEKARKSLGDKALTSLSSGQRTQWSALTGKPFIFRN